MNQTSLLPTVGAISTKARTLQADPESDELTRLFNPRTDLWSDHFEQDSTGQIIGISAIGRTTVYVLDMNAVRRIQLRASITRLE